MIFRDSLCLTTLLPLNDIPFVPTCESSNPARSGDFAHSSGRGVRPPHSMPFWKHTTHALNCGLKLRCRRCAVPWPRRPLLSEHFSRSVEICVSTPTHHGTGRAPRRLPFGTRPHYTLNCASGLRHGLRAAPWAQEGPMSDPLGHFGGLGILEPVSTKNRPFGGCVIQLTRGKMAKSRKDSARYLIG